MGVTASQIIAEAKKHIGYSPASGINKFSKCDVSVAWCAGFVSSVFENCGAINLIPCGRTLSCGTLATAFENKGQSYHSGFKAGDIVFFHWSDTNATVCSDCKTHDHVGIVISVSGNTLTTIEGNTGNSRYGEVKIQTRYASQVSCVGRPKYNSEESEDEEMIEYGKTNNAILSFKQHLRVLKNLGVIKTTVDTSAGFGDGTLKAVKEVQTAAKIDVDGIVGPDTINAVYKLETNAYNALTSKINNAKKALA